MRKTLCSTRLALALTFLVSFGLASMATAQIPFVQLSATPLSIDETGGESTITVSITSQGPDGVSVTLGVSGTNVTPSDWSLSETVVNFFGSEMVKQVTFSASHDFEDEGDEDALIEVIGVTGAIENPQQEVTITIVDDDQALPVELSQFDAFVDGPRVLVRWETLSEISNFGFAVETNSNGGGFEEVGWVNGAGASDKLRKYGFDVEGLRSGIHEIRLRQVDLDGSFDYTRAIEVEVYGTERLQFEPPYPNPARHTAEVSFTVDKETTAVLELFDVNGRRVWEKTFEAMGSGERTIAYIDVSSLAAGLYTARLSTTDDVRMHEIVVVR